MSEITGCKKQRAEYSAALTEKGMDAFMSFDKSSRDKLIGKTECQPKNTEHTVTAESRSK